MKQHICKGHCPRIATAAWINCHSLLPKFRMPLIITYAEGTQKALIKKEAITQRKLKANMTLIGNAAIATPKV